MRSSTTALLFVLLMWLSGEYMTANGGWGLNVLQTADHKMHHTFVEAVSLGILANLMVCLAVWMSYSGRSLMDKALFAVPSLQGNSLLLLNEYGEDSDINLELLFNATLAQPQKITKLFHAQYE